MKEWHVKNDVGWIRIQSDERPEGLMTHRLTGKCLNRPCSKTHIPKSANR